MDHLLKLSRMPMQWIPGRFSPPKQPGYETRCVSAAPLCQTCYASPSIVQLNSRICYVCVINEAICKEKAHNSTNPKQPFFKEKKAALGGIRNCTSLSILGMSALPTEQGSSADV